MTNPTDTLPDWAESMIQALFDATQRQDPHSIEEFREIVGRHVPQTGFDPAGGPDKSAVWPSWGIDWGYVRRTEEFPWDRLRKPSPPTPELYDAHSGRRHTLPSGDFITVDHRGAIRQWDALGNLKTGRHTATPDLCQFVNCEGVVFQDTRGVMRCTCCGRLSDPDPRTSEDAHD